MSDKYHYDALNTGLVLLAFGIGTQSVYGYHHLCLSATNVNFTREHQWEHAWRLLV